MSERFIISDCNLEMVLIQPGRFMMGSGGKLVEDISLFNGDMIRSFPGDLRRNIKISKPFYLSSKLITQKQWYSITGNKPWETGSNEFKNKFKKNFDNFFNKIRKIEKSDDFEELKEAYREFIEVIIFNFFNDSEKKIDSFLNKIIDNRCGWVNNKKYEKFRIYIKNYKSHFHGNLESSFFFKTSWENNGPKPYFNPYIIDKKTVKKFHEISTDMLNSGFSNDTMFNLKAIWINHLYKDKFINIERIEFLGDVVVEIFKYLVKEFHNWIAKINPSFEEICLKYFKKKWGHSNPQYLKIGDDYPIIDIEFNDVVEFIEKLNQMVKGIRIRLPTEAEWEYAAKGVAIKNLEKYAWYSNSHIQPVGTKLPNGFGLYDMFGNVWEFCSDWFAPYNETDIVDPKGPEKAYTCLIDYKGYDYMIGRSTLGKVVRGGSVLSNSFICDEKYRGCSKSFGKHNFKKYDFVKEPIGIRIAAENV